MSNDMVNSPSHYSSSDIECIDAIEAMLGNEFSAYLQGNITKYLWRFKQKNGVEDLKKAQWYLNKPSNVEIRQKLINGDSINVVYNEPWFWICKASFYNKSNRRIITDDDLLRRKRRNQSNKIEK